MQDCRENIKIPEKNVQGGEGGFKKLKNFLVIQNEKWIKPRERALFSGVISLYICTFSIIFKKVIAKIEKFCHFSGGSYFGKFSKF